jgi:hypothetical protein
MLNTPKPLPSEYLITWLKLLLGFCQPLQPAQLSLSYVSSEYLVF